MIDQMCFSAALLEGAKEVFETMVFMDIEESADLEHKIDGYSLLGSITFTGDIEGCLAICCGELCAKAVAANMLGMDPDEQISQDDISDALGEVTNMVMGSVKVCLQDEVSELQVSIPVVVCGQELKNSLGDGVSKVVVTVQVENEYVIEFLFLYREGSK